MKPVKEQPIRIGAPPVSVVPDLQAYLEHNAAQGIYDHHLRFYPREGKPTGFIIHPAALPGHTLDYTVQGNELTQLHTAPKLPEQSR